jgi:hypothetical protein
MGEKMKSSKILLFAVIVLFIHSIAYSQSITVTNPNGGENWVIGMTHNITWTSSGITTGTFTVRLFDGTTNIGIIQAGIPCTDGVHSIPWTVGNLAGGGTVSSGSNFKIKVRQASLAPKDFSDAPFTITDPPVTASIIIRKPNSKTNWCIGHRDYITWNKIGNMNSLVNIFLYNSTATTKLKTIVINTGNDGSRTWAVPTDLPPGNYVIKVETIDHEVFSYSKVFKISRCINFAVKPIQVQRPNCTIMGINPIEGYVSSDSVRFQVNYYLAKSLAITTPGHTVEYCIGAQIPNRTHHDHVYFGHSGCTQGIPFGNNKFSTIEVFYGGNPQVTEPPTYSSHTIEIFIWKRGSGKIKCSRIFNFNHTWHH